LAAERVGDGPPCSPGSNPVGGGRDISTFLTGLGGRGPPSPESGHKRPAARVGPRGRVRRQPHGRARGNRPKAPTSLIDIACSGIGGTSSIRIPHGVSGQPDTGPPFSSCATESGRRLWGPRGGRGQRGFARQTPATAPVRGRPCGYTGSVSSRSSGAELFGRPTPAVRIGIHGRGREEIVFTFSPVSSSKGNGRRPQRNWISSSHE